MISPTAPPPVNWRVNDFCSAFGIGRTKFYSLVKAGQLNPIKLGKTTLIPNTEADRFQASLLDTANGTRRRHSVIG